MKKMINTEHFEGRVYENKLELKTVKNQQSENFGKEFIAGTLDVAVDEEGLNIISVHYTYVTETTKAGGKNRTYATLKNIIDNGKTWLADGKDEATKVKLDPAIAINDFVGNDGNMVSVIQHEGGFAEMISALNENEAARNTFKTDIVITNVTHVDADEEKHIPQDYTSLRGAAFNFRNELIPIELHVKSAGGMKYFEDQDVSGSNPLFTQVWGNVNSMVVKEPRVTENAFGEAAVDMIERKVKEMVVIGASKAPYDFGDEKVLTAEELTTAMQNRETHLADVKKRNEDYLAQKAAGASAAHSAAAPAGGVKTGSVNF